MKKKIAFTATALIAAAVFSGCQKNSGSAASGGGGAKPGGSDSKTVTVLNYSDLTSPSGAEEAKFLWEKFTADNPDIAVVKEDLYNEPFHNKVEVYASANKLPDVLYVWPSGRSTSLHQNKLLKDLTPLINRDGLRSEFLPIALNPSQQGGGYVGMIPISSTSTHAFYVNTEALDACGLKPAKTYSELKAQVSVLKANGYETVIMPNKDSWVMQSCLFSMLAGRFGGEGWEQKILNGSAKFTDQDFVNALAFVRQLYEDGVLSSASLGTSYGDSPGLFASNKGAYMIDGDWRVGQFITDKSTGQALISPEKQKNILITVFPDIEGARLNKSTSGVLGTGWAISAAVPEGSAKEEAAWTLVKYLTGKYATTRRLETGGIATPVRTDIDYAELQREPMQIAIGELAGQYETSTCVIDGVFHSDVFNPLNDGLAELGMGSKTPQQVAADIQRVFDNWKASQ
ncbi:MAG: extracellular solute-binding protein [Spirochaetaceae bacterium]|jgi:raffinose/stachyose/melibiose transport system substrate-binding protein|nr:extracellular solute-binding protein [Spirochaetaceae bacterium]